MAYRYGTRQEIEMFPQSIEDYVAQDDPVRAYDAFVESLDVKNLGIIINDKKEGNPEYNPQAMIKLFLYGCSYGLRSSRKLERACYHNISFIWLMGGLKPDHKTISEFRRNNKKALTGMLKQCAQICIKLGLIEGNTLFLDGTKIRAHAGIHNTFTKERAEKLLAKIDGRIEQILNECETADEKEQGEPSHVKLQGELKDKQKLKTKIETAIKELYENKKKSINTTDKDCVKVKGRQGTHAGYNGQIVTDEKHGLIVQSDVVAESNDINQFSNQIEQAQEIIGKPCENACADAGYANTDDLKKIHDQNIRVIVPTKNQAHDRKLGEFDKEKFEYDRENNCYICPEGNRLNYYHFEKKKNHFIYRICDNKICQNCKNFGKCTKSKKGRRLRRLLNEDTKKELEKIYKTESSQAIYRLRKTKVEHPFGHLKRNLEISSFLLRGIESVKAEMSMYTTCFNISRMITILAGVPNLVTRLSS